MQSDELFYSVVGRVAFFCGWDSACIGGVPHLVGSLKRRRN